SALAAVVPSLAIFLATVWMLGGAREQVAAGTEGAKGSGAPVITARPESVTLTDGTGSTEIQWDTGNGSIGVVFVTGPDRKPVLFATGPKGNQVVPWIHPGKYVFELYGDQDRRTLLANVIVTGNAEIEAAPQALLWRSRSRWLLLLVLLAILYFA